MQNLITSSSLVRRRKDPPLGVETVKEIV